MFSPSYPQLKRKDLEEQSVKYDSKRNAAELEVVGDGYSTNTTVRVL